MISNLRYEGRPLLRLLELYVLRAIDELPQLEQQVLERMAPKLRAIYGGNGKWQAIAAAVRLDSDMPESIREVWVKNLEVARANGVELSPQMFAEMFVDENLSL
ncbi:MAG: hypothetical protein VX569_10340 [Pseudomonadota bacterium]|nr:hypothetical protein [Pseudomonadota bacterium]